MIVPPGTKEPMHHHRWPSLFLYWDTGGRTGHIRYYTVDGSVRGPSEQRDAGLRGQVAGYMDGTGADAFD